MIYLLFEFEWEESLEYIWFNWHGPWCLKYVRYLFITWKFCRRFYKTFGEGNGAGKFSNFKNTTILDSKRFSIPRFSFTSAYRDSWYKILKKFSNYCNPCLIFSRTSDSSIYWFIYYFLFSIPCIDITRVCRDISWNNKFSKNLRSMFNISTLNRFE